MSTEQVMVDLATRLPIKLAGRNASFSSGFTPNPKQFFLAPTAKVRYDDARVSAICRLIKDNRPSLLWTVGYSDDIVLNVLYLRGFTNTFDLKRLGRLYEEIGETFMWRGFDRKLMIGGFDLLKDPPIMEYLHIWLAERRIFILSAVENSELLLRCHECGVDSKRNLEWLCEACGKPSMHCAGRDLFTQVAEIKQQADMAMNDKTKLSALFHEFSSFLRALKHWQAR